MEKRYTALRIISVLYKIVGVIVGILTLLGAVLILMGLPATYSSSFGFIRINFGEALLALLIEIFGGGLSAVGIYAVGELITLLINIEENTRFTALITRDRLQPQVVQPPMQPPYQGPTQPPYQPPPPSAPVQPPYQPPQS